MSTDAVPWSPLFQSLRLPPRSLGELLAIAKAVTSNQLTGYEFERAREVLRQFAAPHRMVTLIESCLELRDLVESPRPEDPEWVQARDRAARGTCVGFGLNRMLFWR